MSLALLFPPSLGHIAASARAELLGNWLSERLDCEVDVSVAGDYAQLEQSILDAAVDLAWAPPAVCARTVGRVEAIFKAVRRGQSEYCSALVTRNPRIRTVADVVSRRAAWVDRLSAGGYLLASAYLRTNGVDPDRELGEQRFYGSYATAVRGVLRGDSDFTAIYSRSGDRVAACESLVELVGERAKHLTVFGVTPQAPTDGLVVTRRQRSPDALDAVQRLCTGFGAVGDGSLLASILDADGLVRAELGDYDVLVGPKAG